MKSLARSRFQLIVGAILGVAAVIRYFVYGNPLNDHLDEEMANIAPLSSFMITAGERNGQPYYEFSYRNSDPDIEAFLKSEGLTNSGRTWAALIKASLDGTGIDMPRTAINLDSDSFFVESSSRADLTIVQGLLAKMNDDRAFLLSCLERARAVGDL